MQSTKSTEVAGVLGIILGSVGAHDWYLGNKKGAMAHVGLLILSLILLVVGMIVLPLTDPSNMELSDNLGKVTMIILAGNAIWGAVEGILILVQGKAGLLKKEERARLVASAKLAKRQQAVAAKVDKAQKKQ